MATLTVRNLDDDVVRRLRIRAAEHGRSAEAEHRYILRVVLIWTFRIFRHVSHARIAQKMSSDAMNWSASSSGKIVLPNGPALVHRSRHSDQYSTSTRSSRPVGRNRATGAPDAACVSV